MGNCVNVLCHSHPEKIKILVFNGGLEEFKASITVEITSGPYIDYNLVHLAQPFLPLPPISKLEPGEIYHPVSLPYKPMVSPEVSANQENCETQKVKIVLTKVQLETLLSCTGKSQSENISIQFMGISELDEGSHKWMPSLDTIKEVQGFLVGKLSLALLLLVATNQFYSRDIVYYQMILE